MKKFYSKSLVLLLTLVILSQACFVFVSAQGETVGFAVDSVNGIRWENYICIYRDIETTGQNQYGCNILVNHENVVIDKIPSGDLRGENAKVPENGYIVSGIGANGDLMYNSVEIGDNAFFDEYGMRILFSSGEITPFVEFEMTVTGFNTVRGENTVIVYNKAGTKTNTNPYGKEAVVNSEGRVISVGGNDNIIPEGGYVVSVIGKENVNKMAVNFTVGAKCELNGNKIKVTYGQNELNSTAEFELNLIKNELDNAKGQYRFIDYSAVENAINSVDVAGITNIEQRNKAIEQIKSIKPMLIEQKAVENRSVWHDPRERTAEEIKETVAKVKKAKLNELIIYLNSSVGTLVPIPETIPFNKDPITESFDLLQTYIDECKANDISLVVVVPVMSNSLASDKKEWLDATNTGEQGEIFYSPANKEYRKAFMDYISYILKNYDVDGFQLDYIRYIGYFGSGAESGYDDDTIALFEEKTGYGADVVESIGKLQQHHKYWTIWRNFKVELINSWVQECYSTIKSIRPDIFVTAAVAESVAKEAYSQDFNAWIKGGYIDGIYPMTYSQGATQTTVEVFDAYMSDKTFLVMGSGAYLCRGNESITNEALSTSVFGADGIAYFEWTAVRDQNYAGLFENQLYKGTAIPLSYEYGVVVEKLVETAKKRVDLYKGENAEEVKKLVPDGKADLTQIENSIQEIEKLISEEDAKWLLSDLKRASTVLKIYGFKVEAPAEESQEASQNEQITEEKGNGWIWVTVGVAFVVILAVVMLVLKNKKK